jgi:hypothetical protein
MKYSYSRNEKEVFDRGCENMIVENLLQETNENGGISSRFSAFTL